MSGRHFDVIVAGLGVMGGATAYHLARAGSRVLGLDSNAPPHDLGSSHGESRIIRSAYWEHPVYVPLARRASVLWRELEAESERSLFLETGVLMLGAADDPVIRGTLRSAASYGVACEKLDAGEIRGRFPALVPSDGTAGVFEPGAGMLLAEACVEAHLAGAARHGATLRFGEPLVGWRRDGEGVVVETARGSCHADALVLAAGAWLPELVPGLPLAVERQPVFWFEPPSRRGFAPGEFPVYLWEVSPGRHFYGFPDVGSGVKAALTHWGETGTIRTLGRTATEADLSPVRRFLERHIPSALGRVARSTVCVYTNTADGHFLIDRHPEAPSVWLLSPCSGHGFKFASVVGEETAASVLAGQPASAIASFGLGRLFGGGSPPRLDAAPTDVVL